MLGYDPMSDDNGVDPLGHGSTVWMQELDEAKPLRHAMHIDVSLAREQAEARVAAALAAGGLDTDGTCGIILDGQSVHDGDECTQTDSCQAGACVGADPVVCETKLECVKAGSCYSSDRLVRHDWTAQRNAVLARYLSIRRVYGAAGRG